MQRLRERLIREHQSDLDLHTPPAHRLRGRGDA
jgi:hypothetical protein